MPSSPFRYQDTPPQYQGPLLTVYQWQQPLSDGSATTFERCIRPDTVAVLAFLDPETILLTREQQLGRTDTFIDAPGGRVDPGETAEAAARRELREETGYEAAHIMHWESISYGGLITFKHHLFIASNLTPAQTITTHDLTEKIDILKTSFEEAYQLCLQNGLRRSEVMLAILRLKHDPAARTRLQSFLA